ncbi:MAG: homogentisate 1,2-dioxygenase domain-containing protein [Quisquiliibacterium sp.]
MTDTMAFMFEARTLIHPTEQALALPSLQPDYWQCWQELGRRFDPTRR